MTQHLSHRVTPDSRDFSLLFQSSNKRDTGMRGIVVYLSYILSAVVSLPILVKPPHTCRYNHLVGVSQTRDMELEMVEVSRVTLPISPRTEITLGS